MLSSFRNAVTVVMLITEWKGEVLCAGNKQKLLLDSMSLNKCLVSSFLTFSS